jgi:hypothetical protein
MIGRVTVDTSIARLGSFGTQVQATRKSFRAWPPGIATALK